MTKIMIYYGIWGYLKFRQTLVTAGTNAGISMNIMLNNTKPMLYIRACRIWDEFSRLIAALL